MLELLRIGIPYNTIMEMDEDQVGNILGVHYALEEKRWQAQQSQLQAK